MATMHQTISGKTRDNSLGKGCRKSEPYRAHAINASHIAPAERTWMAPHPLAYSCSVIEPCARNQLGSRNQALGDTSIKIAFTDNTAPMMTMMLQPRMVFIMGTHNCARRGQMKHRPKQVYGFQSKTLPRPDRCLGILLPFHLRTKTAATLQRS